MISYGTKKRRRPLVSLREHGRRSKIFKESRQADKEDNENVTINVEDTETTDKEHHREIDNENVVDIGSPAWVPDSPIYVPPATFSSPDISDDDSINRMKATTHTTMEVKTIDSFNPNNDDLQRKRQDEARRNSKEPSTVIPFQPRIMAGSFCYMSVERPDAIKL